MAQQTVLVTGNTYPVKDAIKALGGRWDAVRKGWKVPADKADQAWELVQSAGPKRGRRYSSDPFFQRSGFTGPAGRCEDAPCCGCCGPQGDGGSYEFESYADGDRF